MELQEMTPRARRAMAKVTPFLTFRKDGMQTPVVLTVQYLDDIGALLDTDLATELYAEGFAAGRAEVEEELAGVLERVRVLESMLPAALAERAARQVEALVPARPPRRDLGAVVAGAAQSVEDITARQVTS